MFHIFPLIFSSVINIKPPVTTDITHILYKPSQRFLNYEISKLDLKLTYGSFYFHNSKSQAIIYTHRQTLESQIHNKNKCWLSIMLCLSDSCLTTGGSGQTQPVSTQPPTTCWTSRVVIIVKILLLSSCWLVHPSVCPQHVVNKSKCIEWLYCPQTPQKEKNVVKQVYFTIYIFCSHK